MHEVLVLDRMDGHRACRQEEAVQTVVVVARRVGQAQDWSLQVEEAPAQLELQEVQLQKQHWYCNLWHWDRFSGYGQNEMRQEPCLQQLGLQPVGNTMSNDAYIEQDDIPIVQPKCKGKAQ